MKKGDVEGYIKQFEVLRKSAGWSEDKQGTILQFRRGLGSTHNREVHNTKVQRPVTLQDWYKHACNQWKGDSTSPIQVNAVSLTTEVKTKGGLQMSDAEKAHWRQALLKSKDNTRTARINTVSQPPIPAVKNKTMNNSEITRW
jgi:hypothetical protein